MATIDITGQKFYSLTAIRFAGKRKHLHLWEFLCDCGKTTITLKNNVKAGNIQSCGCKREKLFDLTGKSFNGNKVIKPVGKDSTFCVIYLVSCNCGKLFEALGHRIKQGKIKSCGCAPKSPRKDPKQICINSIFSNYNYNAEKRKLNFTLSKEEFTNIIFSNCFYCNLPPSNIQITLKQSLLYSGIDRQNNKEGYSLENSKPCCSVCNKAKHSMTIKEFEVWVDRIIKNKQNSNGHWEKN